MFKVQNDKTSFDWRSAILDYLEQYLITISHRYRATLRDITKRTRIIYLVLENEKGLQSNTWLDLDMAGIVDYPVSGQSSFIDDILDRICGAALLEARDEPNDDQCV